MWALCFHPPVPKWTWAWTIYGSPLLPFIFLLLYLILFTSFHGIFGELWTLEDEWVFESCQYRGSGGEHSLMNKELGLALSESVLWTLFTKKYPFFYFSALGKKHWLQVLHFEHLKNFLSQGTLFCLAKSSLFLFHRNGKWGQVINMSSTQLN